VNSPTVGFATSDFDLSRDAVLVKVKISMVGVTANSKTLSREAASKHEGDRNSFKAYVQKIQWSDLSELTRIYNESKAYLKEKTLGWSEEWRLCPVGNYADLTKAMREYENRFNDGVSKLVKKHDTLEANYKMRVMDIAGEVKFPSKDEMAAAFSFKFEEALIPSGDIRLRHVSEEARKQIAANVKASVDTQLKEAQKEIISRIATVVARIKAGTSEDGKLHESAIEALNQTLDSVPSLNLTNDPAINAQVSKVKAQLGNLDVKDLRKNETVKAAVAATAGSILDDLKAFGSK
jgi:hypothetical protein